MPAPIQPSAAPTLALRSNSSPRSAKPSPKVAEPPQRARMDCVNRHAAEGLAGAAAELMSPGDAAMMNLLHDTITASFRGLARCERSLFVQGTRRPLTELLRGELRAGCPAGQIAVEVSL